MLPENFSHPANSLLANRLYASFGFEPADSDHLASRADQFYKLDL